MDRQAAVVAGRWGLLVIVLTGTVVRAAGGPNEPSLDPFQAAVVDSLRFPERTTPAELLEAAVRAAAVEALEPTLEFLDRFDKALAAAADPDAALAALGDRFPAAEINRLKRFLRAAAPPEDAAAVSELARLMQQAAEQRRADPDRLAAAATDLQSDSRSSRRQAVETLTRGGTAALPELIDLLARPAPAADDPEQAAAFVRTRRLTRQIVGQLGSRGTEALITWLDAGPLETLPGAIATLDLLVDRGHLPAGGPAAVDLASGLLPVATAAAIPEPVLQAAAGLLAKLARNGLAPAELAGPSIGLKTGCRLLAEKLDQLLTPDGLPPPDRLTADDSSLPLPLVRQFLWDPATGRPTAAFLPPAAARCLRARQLANAIAGSGCTDPAAVRLVLLAQTESLARFGADPRATAPVPTPTAAVATLPAEAVLAGLSGPAGFSAATTVEVLDEAVVRELPLAAAIAARALRDAAATPGPFASIRSPLVRALSAASDLVQFEAARTLATLTPAASFPGGSLMIERLRYFAESTGRDRAVIAHPNRDVTTLLASGLSRFGFTTAAVTSGRNCLLAVRQSPDTTLVLVSSRLGDLAARELVQLLRQPAVGDRRPVLVVLDPLDDDRSRPHRTRLVLTLADCERVLLTDRLESLLLPSLDPDDEAVVRPPRFPETLARVAGPQAADDTWRQQRAAARLERAAVALDLLGSLGERGWDVAEALPTARAGLRQTATFAAALRVLAIMPVPDAQRSLLELAMQSDLSDPLRDQATAALKQSIARHRLLLAPSERLAVLSLYTVEGATADPRSRILTSLLAPSSRPTVAADAQESL